MTALAVVLAERREAQVRAALMRFGFTYAQAKALAESHDTVFIVPLAGAS